MGYQKTSTPGIYKRGEVYSVASRDAITKKVQFHSAGKSFNDAKKLKRELETQREQGQSTNGGQLLFPLLWDEFDRYHISNLSPSTRNDYKSIYNRYLLPRYKRTPINLITTSEVLRFREYLGTVKGQGGEPLSEKRIRNIILCLGSFASYAEETHGISNPLRSIKRSRTTKSDTRRQVFLSPEQVNNFLSTVKEVKPDYYCLFYLLAHTGVRLGECLALEKKDVFLDKGRIHINKSVYRGELKTTKNTRGRWVGVSDGLHEVLQSHMESSDSEILFPSRSGGYLDPNGLRRYVFTAAKEKSGLPSETKEGLRIHDLRHSFASIAVANGLSLQCLMELLGHHSYQMVLCYAHLSEDKTISDGLEVMNTVFKDS